MQDWPLRVHRIIDHAAIQHGAREVVSRSVEGPLVRTSYGAIRARAMRLAKRLHRDGIAPGDRVATLAWNTWRHVEAWYGIIGAGAVCHTVNPRLHPDQVAWIVNHAEDRLVFLDATFLPLAEALAPRLALVERFVVLTDAAHMPDTGLRGAIAYETWLAEADDDWAWHDGDENAAAGLCYTSGTTGAPRGVLYSHRSNVLHALAMCATSSFGTLPTDSFAVVVPMFHANAWAQVYALPMIGAGMVLPGPRLDGAALFALMEREGVTIAAGVPTVWSRLLAAMREAGRKPGGLRRVVAGGAACPRPLIEALEREFGIDVFHAWGMTEMSPLGTVAGPKPGGTPPTGTALFDLKAKQGSAPFGVEMVIVDDDGRRLPWDGATPGRVKVRGPAVAARYFREATSALDHDGYFDTGDIATIDRDGTLRIVDRARDLVKSGGEWIATLAIEDAVAAHPGVAEAAVIGVAHPTWGERPLLVVVATAGAAPDGDAVLATLGDKLPRWWRPDDVRFVAELPRTAAGKVNKVGLRALFADHRWPADPET